MEVEWESAPPVNKELRSESLTFLFVVENKETLKHLASLYANNHPLMHLGQPGCPNKSGTFG